MENRRFSMLKPKLPRGIVWLSFAGTVKEKTNNKAAANKLQRVYCDTGFLLNYRSTIVKACCAGKALSTSDPWGSHHYSNGRGFNLDLSEPICISEMTQEWVNSVGSISNLYERQVSFPSLWHCESAGLSQRFRVALWEGGAGWQGTL